MSRWQLVGLSFTFGSTAILEKVNVAKEASLRNNGDLAANCMMCVALVIGTVLTYMTTSDLRRQRAANSSAIYGSEHSSNETSEVYKV